MQLYVFRQLQWVECDLFVLDLNQTAFLFFSCCVVGTVFYNRFYASMIMLYIFFRMGQTQKRSTFTNQNWREQYSLSRFMDLWHTIGSNSIWRLPGFIFRRRGYNCNKQRYIQLKVPIFLSNIQTMLYHSTTMVNYSSIGLNWRRTWIMSLDVVDTTAINSKTQLKVPIFL